MIRSSFTPCDMSTSMALMQDPPVAGEMIKVSVVSVR